MIAQMCTTFFMSQVLLFTDEHERHVSFFAFISTSCESRPVRHAYNFPSAVEQLSELAKSVHHINLPQRIWISRHVIIQPNEKSRGGEVALNNTLLIGCVLRLISIKRLRAAHLSWQGLHLWLFSPLIREILVLLEPRRAAGRAVK